jgi:hypothetical protein
MYNFTDAYQEQVHIYTVEHFLTKWGFGLVVTVAGWHAGDQGSILGRDGLYTFGCVPQHFESASAKILHYINTLIYLLIYLTVTYQAIIVMPTIAKY